MSVIAHRGSDITAVFLCSRASRPVTGRCCWCQITCVLRWNWVRQSPLSASALHPPPPLRDRHFALWHDWTGWSASPTERVPRLANESVEHCGRRRLCGVLWWRRNAPVCRLHVSTVFWRRRPRSRDTGDRRTDTCVCLMYVRPRYLTSFPATSWRRITL